MWRHPLRHFSKELSVYKILLIGQTFRQRSGSTRRGLKLAKEVGNIEYLSLYLKFKNRSFIN